MALFACVPKTILFNISNKRHYKGNFVAVRPVSSLSSLIKVAPATEPPRVGATLATLRQSRALSLDELSRMAGVSKSMLSQIERAQANPTVAVVWRLANALGVPLAELLGSAPPAAAPPAPMPPATPMDGGATAAPKIKPEQMMQMLDFRLYNMQQQLTAIMNAMGVQVDPATLVLPPGTTGAPPAESALPGGPMAPPPPDPSAPAAPQAPGGPMPPGAPMDPSQAPMDPNAGKQASWWEKAVKVAETYNVNEPTEMQSLAAAVKIMLRNL